MHHHLLVCTGAKQHLSTEVQRCRKHITEVVVGELTNKIDATWRTGQTLRLCGVKLLESVDKGLAHRQNIPKNCGLR